MAIELRFTNLGLATQLSHVNAGTSMLISYVRLGTGNYSPDGTETDIMTPFAPDRRFSLGSVQTLSQRFLEFLFEDTSMEDYTFSELGVFDADDNLIMVASHATDDIGAKSADVDEQWIVSLTLTTEDTSAITFMATVPSPATETRAGLVRFATDDERVAGALQTVVVSPHDLAQALAGLNIPTLSPATEEAAGVVRIATAGENDAGSGPGVLTSSGLAALLATRGYLQPGDLSTYVTATALATALGDYSLTSTLKTGAFTKLIFSTADPTADDWEPGDVWLKHEA